jgi:DNA-binding transcriptional LysR family regulator
MERPERERIHRVELRHLRTFREVARSLSFTRAAHELGYVQSAVTSHVKALEADLGVRLFDRLGRRVALTDAGRKLVGHAERILDLMEEARVDLDSGRAEPAGTVTVSATEMQCAYRLPPVLEEFRERFPRVRLVFRPSTPTGVLDAETRRAIAEGVVDAAFVLQAPLDGPSHRDFAAEPLVEEPLVVVARPDHPLAHASEVGPTDLEDETILLHEKGCGYRVVFEDILARAGARPKEAPIEFSSGEAIKRCVEAGMGVAVLARVSVEREMKEGRLVALRWEEPDFKVLTQVVRHRDKWVSPALEAFMRVTREALKNSASSTAAIRAAPSKPTREPWALSGSW